AVPEQPQGRVTLAYPKAAVELAAGTRLFLGTRLTVSKEVALTYQTGNPAVAKVNTAGVITAVGAGRTTLTINVVSTGYSGQLKLPVHVSTAQPLKLAFQPKLESRKVSAGGKSFSISTVTIPKGMPVTAGIASRSVGSVQPLASIAKTYNADIAINGTFFDAYSGVPDPYGNLIRDGLPEHIGNLGTTIGFKWDGSAVMDSLRIKIFGEVEGNGRTSGWYAYFINRKPTSGSAATLFTPARGARLGFAAAVAVIVQNGKVNRIAYGENAAIPKDGYILVFMGAEKGQAAKFKVGDKVTYRVEYQDMDGKKLDWSQVQTAVGAGPRLVKDGKVSLNAADEGFRDPKIISGGGARSGIAIRKDGSV
ncbi:phosphodiester glycosidase family protein, partial [Paenibacillus sepulcri]|nr:phosphodiester glycosidase family protein [Paenibacillus sepulcri]